MAMSFDIVTRLPNGDSARHSGDVCIPSPTLAASTLHTTTESTLEKEMKVHNAILDHDPNTTVHQNSNHASQPNPIAANSKSIEHIDQLISIPSISALSGAGGFSIPGLESPSGGYERKQICHLTTSYLNNQEPLHDQSIFFSMAQEHDLSSSGSEDYESYLFDSADQPEIEVLNPTLAEIREDLFWKALNTFFKSVLKRTDPLEMQWRSISSETNNQIKTECFMQHNYVEQWILSEDQDMVMLGLRRPQSRVFACPFYLRNPQLHRRCLVNSDLRTIKDLKQHIWNSHRRPEHCPVCRTVFERPTECDRHIRSRTCVLSSEGPPEGMTDDQLRELATRARPGIPEISQWFGIWHIAFPTSDRKSCVDQPITPYLCNELESIICVVRDFWNEEGRSIITEHVLAAEASKYDVLAKEGQLECLQQQVLENMLDRLLNCSKYY